VIRKPLPEEESLQTTLFTVGRCSYHAFATNLRIWPLSVYRLHNDAAAVKLIIKELKVDYPLDKAPRQFVTNEAYFHLLLLFAYNLMNWFKCLWCTSRVPFDDLGRTTLASAHDSREYVHVRQGSTLRLPSLPSEQEPIEHTLNRTGRLKDWPFLRWILDKGNAGAGARPRHGTIYLKYPASRSRRSVSVCAASRACLGVFAPAAAS
jgi:hypothetical protein